MADFGTPFVGSTFSRVSSILSQNVILSNLRQNQEGLLLVQEQLATGFRILRPSDDPIGTNRVLDYTIQINQGEQFVRNIESATSRLSVSDAALEDLNEILNRAREIALSQVQSTATAQTRTLAAEEMSRLLQSAIDLGNTRFEDRYLFGGSRTDLVPFANVGNAVAFRGDVREFLARVSSSLTSATNVSADAAFGVFSDELLGRDATTLGLIDLNPALTSSTRLSSLNDGGGVALGSVSVTGSLGTAVIDLRIAERVSDVIDLINARTSVTGVTASINAAQNGLELTDSGAGTIVVQEVLNGIAAADLGILTPPAGVASPLVGSDLDPVVTSETTLGSLFGGAGVPSSGIAITQTSPGATFTATFGSSVFAATATVEQLLNALNGSSLFLDARISETRTGIDIVSRLSGARLTVAENGGGTAAALGWLSTLARSKLTNLNGGQGVGGVDGADLRITLKNGTVHLVDVDAMTTVRDLVAALDGLAGLDAALNASNGITLTDVTGGASPFVVENANGSFAATNLGIAGNTAGVTVSGTTLTFVGEQVEGIFTALGNLQAALEQNQTEGIAAAGRLLDGVQERLLTARAEAGSRVASLELTANHLRFEKTELERFRSETRDLDFAEAASRFQLQQTILESSLAVASRILQTTLLNYL